MTKVYLANALFSEADRMYNDFLADLLRREVDNIDLFVPQEADEINDKNSFADSKKIAEWDSAKLLESDVLIAIIDGNEIDSGVSAEIGMFYMTNKPIIGLFTDVRQLGRDNKKKIDALIEDATENQFIYRNLFTIGLIKKNGTLVSSIEDLVEELNKITS